MEEELLQSRLSRISTIWTLVAGAGKSSPDGEREACLALIQRYQGAAYRYLLGALRDPDAADDLFQEFALRVIQGAFRRADPERGRFRDYLKTTLFHLIVDHQKKRRFVPQPFEETIHRAADSWNAGDSERQFRESWCEELLSRAWSILERAEREGGPPCHAILKFRADNPEKSSAEMAAWLTGQINPPRTYTETAARKLLQRARSRFADALLAEVSHSLGNPALEELERELIDLDLLAYCRSALDRKKESESDGDS
jgi:RNA polymerase sigma factor (sigma-70 family)